MLSYYGPYAEVSCDGCGAVDADLFPDRHREEALS